MARDILSQYGRNTPKTMRASASSGGVTSSKDVMNYSPPQGPKGIMEPQQPGLQGASAGTTNRPTSVDGHSGSPGLGGKNFGCCGSQGRY
jgi:hypothetical protein